MLSKDNRWIEREMADHERDAYSLHECGLCHVLGRQYSYFFPLLISQETVLLNLLVSAQSPDVPEVFESPCLRNPLRRVCRNQGVGSQFAAAITLIFAHLNVQDDIADTGSWTARLLNQIIARPYRHALKTLADIEVDSQIFEIFPDLQSAAEQAAPQQAVQPVATMFARLFAATAKLASMPHNFEALASIGAAYGAYLCFRDALRDYPQDMAHGFYNPLREFSSQPDRETLVLSHEGLEWMLLSLEEIASVIDDCATDLTLFHYKSVIEKLASASLDRTIQLLKLKAHERQDLVFKRWSLREAAKAAAFVLPSTGSSPGLEGFNLVQTDLLEQW